MKKIGNCFSAIFFVLEIYQIIIENEKDLLKLQFTEKENQCFQ